MSADGNAQFDRGASEGARSVQQHFFCTDAFAGSKKLSQPLLFLVHEYLNWHSLGDSSIGLDVFPRKDNFDPRIDPLSDSRSVARGRRGYPYRLTANTHDSMGIELPSRTYLPLIQSRESDAHGVREELTYALTSLKRGRVVPIRAIALRSNQN